ncbi:MAG: ECF-type sigma factor [Gemmataceae bacterium]
MADDPTFHDLIRRVRQGDQQAAAEVVRRYESAIRRAVRFRLTDAGLRRLCDSVDVCQSVLGSFFVRVASGQYELETPDQLLRLLTTMARNKLLSQARHQHAARRDARLAAGDIADHQVPSSAPGPEAQATAADLLGAVRRRLDPDILRLVELRAQGHDWASIAAWRDGDGCGSDYIGRWRNCAEFGLEDGEDDPARSLTCRRWRCCSGKRDSWAAGRQLAVEDLLRDALA